MPEKLAVFWAAGGSTRGITLVRVRVRTYAARELRSFSGMLPQPAGWDTCMPHAMHYQYNIGRYANAQACTEYARYGPVYDAKRAARAPAINYKITIATTLGHTGTNKSMGASIRRHAATHGYRTPHHPTSWARVHRCLSTPWEQPAWLD